MVLASADPRKDVMMARRVNNKNRGPLGNILYRLRWIDRGWLQKDIVARLGWPPDDQAYYSKLETGSIQRPGDDVLLALDAVFELEPETIAYWLEHGPPWATRNTAPDAEIIPFDDDGQLVALLRDIPPHRRKEAQEIARRQISELFRGMSGEDTG